MIQRLEALANPTLATPEPADIAAVEEEVLALREPAQQAQRQESVRPNRPTVVAVPLKVGEPIYKHFRHQKPLVFDGSPDPTEVED